MTVSYTRKVSTSTRLGCFLKLLVRWRGSIYKIVWVDLLLFLTFYYILNITYLFLLNDAGKKYFERVAAYCAKFGSVIPLSFVLGFFVNVVYNRWWSQYLTIPFPDNLAIHVGASIKGQGERSRIVRRTVVRYACVAFTMVLTMISPKVKKRFPTFDHFIKAALLTLDEKKLMEELENEFPSYGKYWLPLAWAANVTTRARHEGIIDDDMAVKGILDEINHFRSKCGGMLDYDWISVPLVYTQVVTLAVYTYFLVTVIGIQFTEEADAAMNSITEKLIFSFPYMPILEFFFYMGWLKVAETLINPFGEDDDDFEVVWMIDRHIQVCFLIVDKIHQVHPTLSKDFYWDKVAPNILPFTVASQDYILEYPEYSTEYLKVKNQDFLLSDYEVQLDSNAKQMRHGLWQTARKRKSGVLKRVVSESMALNSEDINKYEDTGPDTISLPPLTRPHSAELAEEFKQLYEERRQQRKDKLLKCIQLLKSNTEESEKIIDEIVK